MSRISSPRRSRKTALTTAAAVVGALAVPLTAQAVPTCTTPGTESACGGRVVAEPIQSTSFLQYSAEFASALSAIERIAPEIVDITTVDKLTGDPSHVSYDGRQLYVIRLTDESVPETDEATKKDVVASLSIHANESAGREGGIRWAEDIARLWAGGDTDHEMFSGDESVALSELLAGTEIWLGFPNPDGWAAGDLADTSGVVFNRGNGNGGLLGGVDLNREFPTRGWTNEGATPLSEPEAQGWAAFVAGLDDLTTATDIHGEITSATNSWADLMWPAGQWSPTRQAQELQLAQHMTRTIERAFEEDPTNLQTVLGQLHGTPVDATGVATKPASYATAYDIVGYDDGGFMGDWLVTEGAVEIDVENFLSHLVPGNAWVGAYEQAHVIAVRGILESIAVEALLTDDVEADLGALPQRRIGLVDNPRRVQHDDADGVGATGQSTLQFGQTPYDVSPLDYFDDLADDAGTEIDRLHATAVAAGGLDLDRYDSIVVSSEIPAGVDAAELAQQLEGYAARGGQLVLTDAAVALLESTSLELTSSVVETNAGHIDFGELDHAWEADLTGVPSQTYYEVPLGFAPRDSAPHHGFDIAAWEASGGTTVGTVEDQIVGLGELAHEAGNIAVFGAILPFPTEEWPHTFGLNSYGVTVAGGEVLHSILEYARPDAGDTAGDTLGDETTQSTQGEGRASWTTPSARPSAPATEVTDQEAARDVLRRFLGQLRLRLTSAGNR